MDDRLDIPYESVHPETKLDKKLRLYAEADELYEKFVKDINSSSIDGLTKAICLFNIKTQWLERALNDFYDRIAITSNQTNPYVISRKASSKVANSFKRNGKTVGFADLTLGTKLIALKLFSYIDQDSEKKYQGYLQELDSFIKNRNQIIHNLFTQNLETKDKIKTTTEELIRLEVLLMATDQRDSFLAKYLFEHMHEYWDLTSSNKKPEVS